MPITKFSLLAWDDTCNLVKFYKSNGYKVDNNKQINIYDDGEKIYDLISMIKTNIK